MNMEKQIGKRIALARKAKSLTQEDFAEQCGLTVNTISRLENGHGTIPLRTLCTVGSELDVGLDYLLYDLLPKNTQFTDPIIQETAILLEKLDESHKLYFYNILKLYFDQFQHS